MITALNQERSVNLRSAWDELQRVRTTIEDFFANKPEELRCAAAMAALELAENVLKHGADSGIGRVSMKIEAGNLVISSYNRVDSIQKALAVRQRIQRIAERGAHELYIERMLEMLQQREPNGTGLGLLRIVHEGAFQLRCEILGEDRLLIHAERRLSHAA